MDVLVGIFITVLGIESLGSSSLCVFSSLSSFLSLEEAAAAARAEVEGKADSSL
jgi:hypothetical protein